ncbi:hypothetical protein PHLGIDRAFT_307466 [Phlebiopsis gigantea 11061_1 CR5-6]|uniref:Uncharacterized protein n=1 Tax=Phlebiopsis gigantea (strain 11061_1 CR5-6) TaxID=745531 RepID=A0A0C3PR59_PHLG1|nr:hypothetical protein PHLGIDRAFT_307466 [Phlebiopsis gigantea 11061_1 CR5-6]
MSLHAAQYPFSSYHHLSKLHADAPTLCACRPDCAHSLATSQISGRVLAHAHFEGDESPCSGVRIHHGDPYLGKEPLVLSPSDIRETSRSPSPTLSLPFSSTPHTDLDHPSTERGEPPSHIFHSMPPKRRSLQSILVPPFFYPALSSDAAVSPPPPSPRHRSRSASATTSQYVLPPAIPIAPIPSLPSHSAAPKNSPPSDLLDDDPFADLSPAPSTLFMTDEDFYSRPSPLPTLDIDSLPSPRHTPRSPLSQSLDASDDELVDNDRILPWQRSPITPPSTPLQRRPATLRRPKSSGNGQVRPAYTRPAFPSRPSLPSLNTLAQLNVTIPMVSFLRT